MSHVFDYLSKRAEKKKVVSTLEIHIHLPDCFKVGALSSTQARRTPKVEFEIDQEMAEPSPSSFKAHSDCFNNDWKL